MLPICYCALYCHVCCVVCSGASLHYNCYDCYDYHHFSLSLLAFSSMLLQFRARDHFEGSSRFVAYIAHNALYAHWILYLFFRSFHWFHFSYHTMKKEMLCFVLFCFSLRAINYFNANSIFQIARKRERESRRKKTQKQTE